MCNADGGIGGSELAAAPECDAWWNGEEWVEGERPAAIRAPIAPAFSGSFVAWFNESASVSRGYTSAQARREVQRVEAWRRIPWSRRSNPVFVRGLSRSPRPTPVPRRSGSRAPRGRRLLPVCCPAR
jgi:hypothetical protein